jgi:hypothetical protein
MTKRRSQKKPKRELSPIGRPTVFTPEVVLKLEEAFKMDCTDGEACAYAGIGQATYYAERARNEAFRDRMDRCKEFPFMLAKKTVLTALATDDGALAIKWLKNRQRDRYHEKVEEVVKQEPIEELIREVDQSAEYPEQFQTS